MRLAALLGTLAVLAAPATAGAIRLPARGTAVVTFKGKRAAFVRDLRRIGLRGRTVVLRKLPIAAVRGVRAQLRAVAGLRRVTHVERNRRLEYHLHDSAPLVFGGSDLRDATYTAGFDGSGVNVAVIDTGADGTHPDLAGRLVKNLKVVSGLGVVQYLECPDGVPCDTDTTGGHGTHVAGIMVGDGTASDGFHRGIAPGAGLVALGVGEAVAVLSAAEAMDYILAHPELHVVAVNNSYGEEGVLFDQSNAINVASRKLTEAGISVVFSAGNQGVGPRTDPEGASDCSLAGGGADCKINQYSVAPWAISVANARKDAATPEAQPLSFSSSRGDDRPGASKDGSMAIDYMPTLTAPGTNIWSARAPTGAAGLTCGSSAEAPSCLQYPEHLARYVPVSGTSMAAPHVTGAIAVLQDAAQTKLGRLLTPAEVKDLLQRTARPMTAVDGLWDFPCGDPFAACGTQVTGTTGQPLAPWQNGAGFVDVVAAIDGLPPAPTPTPGASPAPTATPSPAPTVAPDVTAPALTRVSLRKGRVRLTLSEPARVVIVVRRPGHRPVTAQRSLPAGRSVVRLHSVRRRARVRIVATDAAGNASAAVVRALT